MASKLLNLVALSSLAIMACTFGAAPTTALSTGHLNHANRHVAHAPIAAKKKRDQSKRCKARPSTSLASSTAAHTSTSVHAQAAAVTSSSSHSQAPASTTTKSSAPATTSKASSGGSSTIGTGQFGKAGSKICAAWGNGNDPSLANFKTDHVVALYDWGVDKPSDADKLGFMYMPMLWGGSQDKISAFEAAIKPGLGSIILGFNEPNEQGQSNMDPQTAAALWKQHIEPKRSMGYKFCSPAMSSRPNGFQWMQEFMAACDGCNVDMQCLHWYDIGFDTLKTYLTKYHDEFNLPIMLTEFAEQNFNGGAQATMDEIWDFMGQALKWFDETDWILAACPFGIMHDLQGVNTLNLLQNSDGSPTALGSFVINDGNN